MSHSLFDFGAFVRGFAVRVGLVRAGTSTVVTVCIAWKSGEGNSIDVMCYEQAAWPKEHQKQYGSEYRHSFWISKDSHSTRC